MDCSLPGSSVHGIFQARVLEWVAISLKYTINIMCWSYPKPSFPILGMKKLFSMKLVSGTKKVGYHCTEVLTDFGGGHPDGHQGAPLLLNYGASWLGLTMCCWTSDALQGNTHQMPVSHDFPMIKIKCVAHQPQVPKQFPKTQIDTEKFLQITLLFSRSVISDSVTPWTAACQASLFFTISHNLLKLLSIESVMPPNHLILSPSSPSALSLSQHQGLFQ